MIGTEAPCVTANRLRRWRPSERRYATLTGSPMGQSETFFDHALNARF
jgi:hypothetical protein